MFFFAVYIHMFRGLYYGSYKAPREVLWILGVIIYLLMMATAFFGYVLPWGQMSFWGATVITNLFSSIDQIIPHAGTAITTWLWGGFAVGDPTLNRFFSLHYLLPFVIAGVVGLHIWALHVPGNNNPLGIDVKGPQDTVPFHPYYTVKDAFYLSLFLLLFAFLVFFHPNFVGDPDNYLHANPLATPAHIVPEWYLLPFYAMLRAVPQKLLGVLTLFGAIVTLALIPWLDTSKVRSLRFRPMLRPFFWFLVVDCIILGYLGSKEPQAVLHLGGAITISYLWIARVAAIYYYSFFWLILPIVGIIETPKPLPESIAKSVLGDDATAPAAAE
jgi:ubiquinol-cytochrome c reductase cytochrome b subunit